MAGSIARSLRWTAFGLAVLSVGCSPNLTDHTLVDAVAADLRLCGFPPSQLDASRVGAPHYLTSLGVLHLGQRLRVEVAGDADRLVEVRWVTEPAEPSWATRREPHVRFSAASSRVAFLEAVSLSGDDEDFAYAEVRFRDGTDDRLAPSVCASGGWQPANRITVVP